MESNTGSVLHHHALLAAPMIRSTPSSSQQPRRMVSKMKSAHMAVCRAQRLQPLCEDKEDDVSRRFILNGLVGSVAIGSMVVVGPPHASAGASGSLRKFREKDDAELGVSNQRSEDAEEDMLDNQYQNQNQNRNCPPLFVKFGLCQSGPPYRK